MLQFFGDGSVERIDKAGCVRPWADANVAEFMIEGRADKMREAFEQAVRDATDYLSFHAIQT